MTMNNDMTAQQPLLPSDCVLFERHDAPLNVSRIEQIEQALIKRTVKGLGPFTNSQLDVLTARLACWHLSVVEAWNNLPRLTGVGGMEVKNEWYHKALGKGLDACCEAMVLMKMIGQR
jgi:hypothetical protein